MSSHSDKIVDHSLVPAGPRTARSPIGEQAFTQKPEYRPANPFGLRPLVFGLLVALIACILTAAIVGGVVGGVTGDKHTTRSVGFYLSLVNDERLMAFELQHPFHLMRADNDGVHHDCSGFGKHDHTSQFGHRLQ